MLQNSGYLILRQTPRRALELQRCQWPRSSSLAGPVELVSKSTHHPGPLVRSIRLGLESELDFPNKYRCRHCRDTGNKQNNKYKPTKKGGLKSLQAHHDHDQPSAFWFFFWLGLAHSKWLRPRLSQNLREKRRIRRTPLSSHRCDQTLHIVAVSNKPCLHFQLLWHGIRSQSLQGQDI